MQCPGMSGSPCSVIEDFISGVENFCDQQEMVSWNDYVPEVGDYKPMKWIKDMEYTLSVHFYPWRLLNRVLETILLKL